MLRSMVRIAVGQICSTASPSHNLQQCKALAEKASAAGAQALFLPEASDYIASSAAESLSLAQPSSISPFVQGLRFEARRLKLAINVGVHETGDELATGKPAEDSMDKGIKKLRNTLLWIDEEGDIVQRYYKIHLFDVDLKDGPKLKESDVEPGTTLASPFPTPIGNIAMLICFDLRFPLASHTLRFCHTPAADIITYPSAFTIPTGKAHWSTLLRARAIETQSYVVAAAQVGAHNEKRMSYGHSMVVGPWGEVLCELSGDWKGESEIGIAEVDLGAITKVRGEVPLRSPLG